MKLSFLPQLTNDSYKEIQEVFSNSASIYHSKAWHGFIATTLKWPVGGILGRENKELCYFLPVVRKRTLAGKVKFISLPLSHQVYPLKSSSPSLNDFKAIGIERLEVHGQISDTHFKKIHLNYGALLKMSNFDSTEQLLEAFNKSSIQRKISRAAEYGVEIINESSNQMAFKLFYDMELKTRRKQGSLIYPQNFFERLYHHLSPFNLLQLYIAYIDKKPSAGIIFLRDRNTAIYSYGASYGNPKHLAIGINQAVMWEAIKHAFKSGITIIDFGTTPIHLKSLLEYKRKWSTDIHNGYYSFYSENGKFGPSIDRQGIFPQLISKVIPKLPLSVYKRLSPTILKVVL